MPTSRTAVVKSPWLAVATAAAAAVVTGNLYRVNFCVEEKEITLVDSCLPLAKITSSETIPRQRSEETYSCDPLAGAR